MQKTLKSILLASLIVALSIGAYWLYEINQLLNEVGDHCTYRPLRINASPNRTSQATTYEVNCGATTGFAYTINITTSPEAPNQKRDDHVFSKSGRDDVGVHWENEKHLIIKYGKSGRTYKKLNSWKTYQISYYMNDY